MVVPTLAQAITPHLAARVERPSDSKRASAQPQQRRKGGLLGRRSVGALLRRGVLGDHRCRDVVGLRGVRAPLLDRLAGGVPGRREAELLALGEDDLLRLGARELVGVAHKDEQECSKRIRDDRPRVRAALRKEEGRRKQKAQPASGRWTARAKKEGHLGVGAGGGGLVGWRGLRTKEKEGRRAAET